MIRRSPSPALLGLIALLSLGASGLASAAQPLSELNKLCADAIAADTSLAGETRASTASMADPDVEPTDNAGDEAQTSADILCHRVSFTISRLAPGSPEHVQSIIHLGDIKARAGHYIDAAPFYSQALSLVSARNPGSLLEAKTLETLADAKLHYAKFPEAEGYVRDALAIREKLGLGETPETAVIRVMRADLLLALTDNPHAEQNYLRARDDLAKAAKRDSKYRADYLEAQRKLAQMYAVQQRYELADREYSRLLQLAEAAPQQLPLITQTHQELGWITAQLGRPDQATAHFRKALDLLKARNGSPTAVASVELQLNLLGQAQP